MDGSAGEGLVEVLYKGGGVHQDECPEKES